MKNSLLSILIAITVASLIYFIFYPTTSDSESESNLIVAPVSVKHPIDTSQSIKLNKSDSLSGVLDSSTFTAAMKSINFQIEGNRRDKLSDTTESALYEAYLSTKETVVPRDSAFQRKAKSILSKPGTNLRNVATHLSKTKEILIRAEQVQKKYYALINDIDDNIIYFRKHIDEREGLIDLFFILSATLTGLTVVFSSIKAIPRADQVSKGILYVVIILTFLSTMSTTLHKYYQDATTKHSRTLESLLSIRTDLINRFINADDLKTKESIVEEYKAKVLRYAADVTNLDSTN